VISKKEDNDQTVPRQQLFPSIRGVPVRPLTQFLAISLSAWMLAACAGSPDPVARSAPQPGPETAGEALKDFFSAVDRSGWPRSPAVLDWPTDQALTRIAVGSCRSQEAPAPVLDALLARDPDLFLYIGDNVYGDVWSLSPDMAVLKEAYGELSQQEDFQRVAARVPILPIWDDHDYGMNDAGGSYYGKFGSEAIFETYWGLEEHPMASRDGVYYSQTFGPEGERVQVIMLDTRFFRTALTRSPDRGAPGMERYIPSEADDQDMLGGEQWAWLEETLRQPAELRLLVSSVQVLADAHGWEAWKQLPQSQSRLFETIARSEAGGVVLISGDRHLSALYRQTGVTDYPLYELTASSLNRPVRDENDEMSSNQLGAAYSRVNFGEIEIDWQRGLLTFTVRDVDGHAVRDQSVALAEIGVESRAMATMSRPGL